MKKTVIILVLFLLCFIGSFVGGCFFMHWYENKDISTASQGVIAKPVVTQPVKRKTITFTDATGHLKHYDEDIFTTKYVIQKQTSSRLYVGSEINLYQRSMTQDLEFKIEERYGWKFYTTIAVVAAAAGGITYLLVK